MGAFKGQRRSTLRTHLQRPLNIVFHFISMFKVCKAIFKPNQLILPLFFTAEERNQSGGLNQSQEPTPAFKERQHPPKINTFLEITIPIAEIGNNIFFSMNSNLSES